MKIYGRLETLLNEPTPSYKDMLFCVGTLKGKMNLPMGKVLSVLDSRSCWDQYMKLKAEEFLSRKERSNNNFFFSMKKEAVSSKPKQWFFGKGFARTVANNELALDLDTREDFENAVHFFRLHKLKGNCRTWHGSKGGHVSFFFNEPVTNEFRDKVRRFFNADLGQVNCTVENKPHQKTGSLVEVICKNEGMNNMAEFDELIAGESLCGTPDKSGGLPYPPKSPPATIKQK